MLAQSLTDAAGGYSGRRLGTRLRPLTETIPQGAGGALHGEPFLAHQFRLLRARGVDRVVLCIGYLGEKIRDFAGDGSRFGLRAHYAWDGPVLRGTAGAVRNALPLLGEAFFVLYGDSYLPCDYAAAEQAFRESGKPALMTVFHNQDRWDKSNVEFRNGQLLAYDKKVRTPRMRHIDYGLGVFRREAFTENAEADLASLYQSLLQHGQLAGCEVKERFYEIGSLAGLRELSIHLGG